ncbi:hypothetical protein DFH94DRAFT_205359 [Russula ochroleuca]|uniref:LysM domain-containing protein n=1 Tax=Russula ochroleuca TaxID=152965 RepID=A0A9P5JZG0_9AGAM|nr:hypothetical protein DFH94DRAFT_205359 [Russula ochroleuca]
MRIPQGRLGTQTYRSPIMLSISTANLVSALALCSTLTGLVLATGPRTQCSETYNAPQGATCTSIGEQLGLNPSTIQSMNPGVNCNDLSAGALCLKQWTPVCTLNATATSQTCDGLAEKWDITQSDFVNYNDNVNDACSNLVIGQPYCVSIEGCYPGNEDPTCQQ